MSLQNLLTELKAAKKNLKSRDIEEYKQKIKNAKTIVERLLETDKNNKEIPFLYENIILLTEKKDNDKKLASSPMAQTNLNNILGNIIKKCEILLKHDSNYQIDFEQEEQTSNTSDSCSETDGTNEFAIFSLELENLEKQQSNLIQSSNDNTKQPSIIEQQTPSPKRYSKSYKSFFLIEELPLPTDEDSLSSSTEDDPLLEKLSKGSLTSSNYSTATNSSHWSSISESTSSSLTSPPDNDDELEQGSYGINGSLELLFNR